MPILLKRIRLLAFITSFCIAWLNAGVRRPGEAVRPAKKTVSNTTLQFVLDHCNDLFPGVPIVLTDVDHREVEGKEMPPDVTGLCMASAVAQALARSAEQWKQRGETAESRARLAKLTPREFLVMRLVIAGLLNKQIAAELGIAVRIIKTHRSRLVEKIGVISGAELVIRAQKAGVAAALGTWKVARNLKRRRHDDCC